MNRYCFSRDHGIAMHSDASQAYEECDPITSLSMKLGSFLLVSAKQRRKRGMKERWCLVIYQPPNSMLIMGGKFQTEFEHAVPTFASIKKLVECVEGQVVTWMEQEPPIKILWFRNAKEMMEAELRRLESVNLQDFNNARWNVTIRWCRHHFGSNCPVLRRRTRPDQEMASKVVGSQPSAPSARSAPPAVAWDPDSATQSLRQWKERASLRSAQSEISRPGPMTPPEASASAMPPSPVEDLLMTLKCLFEMSDGSERSKSLFTGCSTVRILF